ncbi:hypothetical protein WN51_06572 [Melipona quadrifasciata]|uniref:PiggyBac transposable element-derived protein domain-containing protein n=1 Tax=Melipona quadrifasciata TaxID=166423 RepID=A0A0N0BCU8_9HYME|nr:hypothetical protein WN51_06572 [Melipona quadrifasciata]
MRKSRRCNKILDKILEINEDYSEDTSEENECELGESEPESETTQSVESGSKGRTPIRMIFKDIGGPTAHAKRNIMVGCMLSAFDLIIDKHIMQHIKDCTETEARRVLKTDWTITIAELRSFIGVLYARGAYEARSLKASYLWSKKWGPPFLQKHNEQR